MYSDCHLLRTQFLWKRLFWNKRESNHCIKNNFKMMSFYTRDVHTSLIYQPTSGRTGIFPSHGFWSDTLFTKMSGADRTPMTWEDESAHVQWKHLVNIRHALVFLHVQTRYRYSMYQVQWDKDYEVKVIYPFRLSRVFFIIVILNLLWVWLFSKLNPWLGLKLDLASYFEQEVMCVRPIIAYVLHLYQLRCLV